MTVRRQKHVELDRRNVGRPRKFTQEQIVQAALDVMEREGYDALTARSLGKELGIVSSVVFNYFDRIEDIEAEALQHLAASIPMPKPGTPKEIRKQAIDCLLITREVLVKHPGVLTPPIESRAAETFRECVVQWIIVLTPFASNAETAAIGHGALVNAVARSAEFERHYGPEFGKKIQKIQDPRLPGAVTLLKVLNHLLDQLFPGLPKSK